MPQPAMRREETCSALESDQRAAEDDLFRVQRQYRIVEGHRKSYFEEARNLIRKQKTHIDSLHRENGEIDIDLALAISQRNVNMDKDNTFKLQNLLASLRQFQKDLKDELQSSNQLDNELLDLEKKVQDHHQSIGGYQVDRIRHVSTQKKIRVLENRLNKTIVGFNSALTNNSELREHIDHLRRERAIYDKLYKKLSKEQEDFKQHIGNVIEESTSAYDTRDEAQAKMSALRDRSEKDQTQYNLELKELKRIIDHEQKLKAFMNTKAQERAEVKALEAAKRKKREDKEKEHGHNEEIERYEKVFERLKATAKDYDLDHLVHHFIQKEDVNFALFNYVNELNDETLMMQEEIKQLNSDIQEFQKQGQALDKTRQGIMKNMEVESTLTSRSADTIDRRLKSTSKLLDHICTSIECVFRRLNCDRSIIEDRLGATTNISAANVMMYLGQIECTTNELLLIQNFLQLKEARKRKAENPPPPKAQGSVVCAKLRPKPVATIKILPPCLTEEEIPDEEPPATDELQPLTSGELKNKASRAIKKKELTRMKLTTVPVKSGNGTENQQDTNGANKDKSK